MNAMRSWQRRTPVAVVVSATLAGLVTLITSAVSPSLAQGLTTSRELSTASVSRAARPACEDGSTNETAVLSLTQIFKLALCQSVLYRQAKASAAEQQANSDLVRAGFQPLVTLSSALSRKRIPLGSDSSNVDSKSFSTLIGLSWVIFDFGQRNALLSASQEQLAAALLGLDSSELQAIADALRLYVEAVGAWERLAVVVQAQDAARQSVVIAQGRYEGQIGTLADKLLADTTLAQATLERVRAETAWDIARGALALSLGWTVGRTVALDGWRAEATQAWGTTELGTLDRVTDDALQLHPRAQALKAEVRALQARAEALRFESRGSVSLSSSIGASRALEPGAVTSRNLNGSVFYSVPLFQGDTTAARRAQFEAQIEGRNTQYLGIERELKLELWKALRQLQADEESLTAAAAFLKSATASLDVATGRYKAGVASLTELLAAQTNLTTARFQQSQAMVATLASKIRLVVASGRLPIRF